MVNTINSSSDLDAAVAKLNDLKNSMDIPEGFEYQVTKDALKNMEIAADETK